MTVVFDGQYQCGSKEPVPIHLTSSLPVDDSRMRSIVATFHRAFDDVMKDLLALL